MEEDKKDSLIVCRVCLRCFSNTMCMSLFVLQNERLIADMITSIAKVEIKQGDNLPQHICNECFNDLQNALTFKQKCEYSYTTLTSGISKNTCANPLLLLVKEELPIENDFDYSPGNDSDSDYKDYQKPKINELEGNSNDLKLEIKTEPTKKSKAVNLNLQCNDCGGFFKTKCKMRVHWKKAHEKSYLKCERCKRQFKSFKAYHTHKKRNPASCAASTYIRIEGEGRNRMFHCKDCDYKSHRVKDLITHYLLHSGHRPHKCSVCSRGFTQLSSLFAHEEGIHKLYKMEGTCHVCGKQLKGRNKFYKHLKRHEESAQQCEICKKVFKTKKILRVHMVRHSDTKTVACEICGTRYYTMSDLSNHRRNTHFKVDKTFKCDLCGYVTVRNETLKRHKAKHTATNIPCKFCGTFLENEQAYLLHIKRHLDKNFPCPDCDKRFHKKRYLTDHMKSKHGGVELDLKVTPKKVKIKQELPVIVQYNGLVEISPTIEA